MRQADTGLPASFEAAWGLQPRPAKGPKPTLTLERIVDAGVRIAAAEGLAAVSMARVAKELDASTMALYRYVTAKDELLALMVDVALGPPPNPADRDEGWREGLRRWAWSCRERMVANVWALRIPIQGPPTTPNQVAWLEAALWSLRDTSLSEEDKASVVLLMSGYARNEATLTADLAAAGALSDAGMLDWSGLMRRVTDPARFPALHAVLAAGVFDKADPPEKEFGFGLERILDGIESLLDEVATRHRPGRRAKPTAG
ncbi:MAG: TetR/AcrR family transcriptional regulator C-terminal domain-containing protein [Solirubrobacterales bacterium]|nr:TetR/AcrR family transcriptional regulator C-terminal domain-containing protein [Solirubrobacterales bacterium]